MSERKKVKFINLSFLLWGGVKTEIEKDPNQWGCMICYTIVINTIYLLPHISKSF